MPFTTIDDRTALIVIDLQKGIAALPPQEVARPAIANAVKLIESFRANRRPVVLVNVLGGAPGRTDKKPAGGERPADWAELLPELGHAPDDVRISKKTWGAFTGTDLDKRLHDLGVTGVVVCGISTSRGVESTARFAHELGYNVALPVDAMADSNLEAHRRSIELIFPWIAETGTTDELIALLK
ncbi:isochorismatase family protein [Pleomorphomonas oryzae]|uniref:isochorismatase family protein n=1 Tax=Pleomorphomonas oryzae TaxID=261934 RepID=UPI000424C3ED|nr:isochorismatase family protein [Pleomorphomonas oryzae]